jgi:hypothetical protein
MHDLQTSAVTLHRATLFLSVFVTLNVDVFISF